MNFNSLFINTVKTRSQLINYQTLRWRRGKKPFWLGMTKSKRFIVPQSKSKLNLQEKRLQRFLHKIYNVQLKSLLNFIQNTDPKLEYELSKTDSEGKAVIPPALKAEMLKSFENNSLWNAESARRRDERMKLGKEKAVEEAFKTMEIKDEESKRKMELLEEIVRKEKILSESFVTPENLDESIEKCLNNIDEYDFAIDLQGKRYPGSKSLTPKLDNAEVSEAERASA